MIVITQDHVADKPEQSTVGQQITEMPLYGMERAMGETGEIPNDGPVARFRLYDDDGELLYSGTLTDDDDCANQAAALRWGEAMAGATVIKMYRNGKLVEEIG